MQIIVFERRHVNESVRESSDFYFGPMRTSFILESGPTHTCWMLIFGYFGMCAHVSETSKLNCGACVCKRERKRRERKKKRKRRRKKDKLTTRFEELNESIRFSTREFLD